MLDDLRDSLIVLIVVLALTLFMYILRRKRPHGMNMDQRNLIATNYGFFTTLYTFFLGFAVVTLWQSYNGADDNVTAEADMIMAEYQMSQGLPDSQAFRQALLDYAGFVSTAGWEAMRRGETDDGAGPLFMDIWSKLLRLKPDQLLDQSYYTLMVEKFIDLSKIRNDRLLAVEGNLYPPIWFVIYLGVFFTIFGFFFIDSEHRLADFFYIFMMVSMVMANIFLVYELNTPFSGYISIEPGKLNTIVARLQAFSGGL